jgi:tRNA 2-thiouridine synthesizing protein A
MDANRLLDLSGEVCPFTFVKTKLELEIMAVDELLTVVVDNSESAANVPRSLDLEGQEVLSVQKTDVSSKWEIVVRKKQ